MTPLRRRMIEDMQIRNLAPRTQVSYVEQVDRFAAIFTSRQNVSGRPRSEPGRFTWRRASVWHQFDLGRSSRDSVPLHRHTPPGMAHQG